MKMAALPSPTQVAGNHNSIYESYYQLVDPNNQGSVGALDAAKFLKKSGLSDNNLSKIWDLSDPNGKGYLNKPGFFVALKLVSLAQNGREANIANILSDVPPPKMADLPPLIQNNVINSVQTTLSDWAIKPHEREKYDQLFDSLQPLNGVIPGNKVKGLLMDSKLPVDTLGKIWDLADMDKDGSLDRHEFIVAMHLVYKALEKYAIPNSVPPELLPPGKRKDPLPPTTTAPIIPIAPITKPTEPAKVAPPSVSWVVTAEEKAKYDVLFHQSDVDKDGFVSGYEIKNVFLQSGVPQLILARIWGLCDMKQTGKLNGEQFALAMWLISQKLQGKDPPAALTPEMVPPGARGKPADTVILSLNGAEREKAKIVSSLQKINSVQVKKIKTNSLRVCLLKKITQKKISAVQPSISCVLIKSGKVVPKVPYSEYSDPGRIDSSCSMETDCHEQLSGRFNKENNNKYNSRSKIIYNRNSNRPITNNQNDDVSDRLDESETEEVMNKLKRFKIYEDHEE